MDVRSIGLDRSLGLSLLLIVLTSSFLSASTLYTGSSGAAGTDDWPMFHHDLQHKGYSMSTAPGTIETVWSYSIGSIYFSSPAVADRKVYIGSYSRDVYCLDAASGAFVWRFTTGSVVDSSPAVADSKVYVGSWDTNVYCLNAATGTLTWSYTTGGSVVSSPAVADGKVYVGSLDGNVYCLNADSGAYIWNYTTGFFVDSSPAVVDGKVYFGSWDGKIYCLNAATGAHIWNYSTGWEVQSSPAVADGKVYIGSNEGKVYCLDASTGAFVWSYTTGGGFSSPAIVDGKVYVGSWDDKIYCLNAATGTSIWNYTTGGTVQSSPAVADGKVYIGSGDYNVYCLDAVTGAFIWNYATGNGVSSSPAVADGKVYIGSQDGKIYGFGGTSTPAPPTPSPTPTPSPSPSPTPPPSPAPYRRISDFDVLFKHNNTRVIYPSDHTPKPLGCAKAMVSDWAASTFISTKLENATESLDTDSLFVSQSSGKSVGPGGTGIVSFGGPVVNPVVAYAESSVTPSWERAPIRYYSNAGVLYFQHANGTAIAGANLQSSVISPGGENNMDMFLIEVYQDGDGRFIMLCYGFGWKGTYAAGKYFDAEIYPNIANYNYSWTIVKWEDTNGNGFVNTATDGDTYTVIATG